MNDFEDIYLLHINRYYNITSLRKKIKCLFHNENTASLAFFKKDGQWMFKCFGCGVSGNIYSFLMKLYSIDFKEALIMTKQHYNQFIPVRKYDISQFSVKPVEEIDIIPQATDFTKAALNFFDEWSISKSALESLGWIQCKYYSIVKYVDHKIIDIRISTPESLCFAIITKDIAVMHPRCKIYTPDHHPKMFGNTNAKTLIIPDMIIPDNPVFCYTGGMKDCAVFNSLKLPMIGVSTNSENVIGSPDDLPGIKVCLMDNDEAGKKAEEKYNAKGIKSLSKIYSIANGKDFALCVKNNKQQVINYINNEYQRIIDQGTE